MIIYDMTDEEIREVVRRAARAEGLEEGREQGLEEGREQGLEEGRKLGIELGRAEGRADGMEKVSKLIKIFLEQNNTEGLHRITEDAEYRETLLKEYEL